MSGGRASRDKGNRAERELVDLHKALGCHAERYPLSGSSRFRGSGHDVDLYLFGRDDAPLVARGEGTQGRHRLRNSRKVAERIRRTVPPAQSRGSACGHPVARLGAHPRAGAAMTKCPEQLELFEPSAVISLRPCKRRVGRCEAFIENATLRCPRCGYGVRRSPTAPLSEIFEGYIRAQTKFLQSR